MNFGIDKCKTCSIEKGKLRKQEGFQSTSEQIIQGMNTNECYKYLGFIQTPIIDMWFFIYTTMNLKFQWQIYGHI
jgi:hypothetical protein